VLNSNADSALTSSEIRTTEFSRSRYLQKGVTLCHLARFLRHALNCGASHATRKAPMKTIALALCGTLATACYADPSLSPAQMATSAKAPLAQYASYSFGRTADTPSAYAASAASLADNQRLRDLVRSVLGWKGYVEDTMKPSFLVKVGSATRQLAPASSEADPLGVIPKEVINFEAITIEIYDSVTKTEVWKGSATSMVDDSKERAYVRVQREVQDALASFPPRAITQDQHMVFAVTAN
jgi:hypothetical protein